MDEYLVALFASELPFAPWVAALVWVALFAANHSVVRSLHAANDLQRVIVVEDWSVFRRGFDLKYLVARILVAVILFVLALSVGEPAFVLVAGGLIVALAFGLGLNVQGLLSARAMARPDAVNGALTFSNASAFRHMAQRAGGSALACLLLGLTLAHLALLGGALFLTSSAAGYLRKAQNIRTRP